MKSMEDYDRKCVCCGAIKYVPYLKTWGYKFEKQFCCSYSCMRKMEKKIDICDLSC